MTPKPKWKPTATSPCIGVCTMGSDGLCLGCRRTLPEIAQWSGMADDARRRWIHDVQPTRPPGPFATWLIE
ncbi:MAG: DUF1289 domain-containing protein [Nevskiaceae bacterium]|nr:MAG: DUF1289 domain-containing protein [Nevskiaceae bacterium]TBR73916.1 MAG: DUF1289 domain-containing protein [Nevskiaceae bacterium]